MIKGILPVNKPNGWTSFDVVNKIKKLLHIKKVGHLGTLDPMATGVLLVTINQATKLFDLMQQKTKTYIATFEFGYLTDTLDSTGKTVKTTSIIPCLKDIKEVISNFIGEYDQIPPKYSAKSVNGKRAYELARDNKEFDLKPKRVFIRSISILAYQNKNLTLKIECGSGTYIRAIGRDIADKINTFATMTKLERTDIDKFNIKDCIIIDKLNEQNILEYIIPINKVLNLPELNISDDQTKKILNGQIINLQYNDGIYKLNANEDTIALVELYKNNAKMKIFLG